MPRLIAPVVCVNFLVEDAGGDKIVVETIAPYTVTAWTKTGPCWTVRAATEDEMAQARAWLETHRRELQVFLPFIAGTPAG